MTGEEMRPLGYGEPAPAAKARSTVRPVVLATLAGRDVELVFVSSLGGAADRARLAACRRLIAAAGEAGIELLVVSTDAADRPADALREPGIDGRVLLDGDGRLAAAFGIAPPVGDAATAFHLDRALRVVERRSLDGCEAIAGAVATGSRSGAGGHAASLLAPHPPVLLLDKVFEPAFMTVLIRHFDTVGGVESGFMTRDGDLTRGRIDRRVKRRRDVFVEDPVLIDQIRKRLMYRLAPMIAAAFQFEVAHIERYLVARYDSADRGTFRAHRDNDTSGTAHRRFAVSINLNDDFEGGFLRFPEFGDDVYRPQAGSAVAFSCSLLHEATPVTAGTRYAFLTFLYGAADAETLERNRASVIDEGRGALAKRA